MKKFILPLVLLFAIASAGFASSNLKTTDSPSGIPQVKSISIDLGDITNMTESEVSELITELLEICLPSIPKLQCSVTVGAEMQISKVKISISVTVSGDCDELRQAGAEIAQQVMANVKAELARLFQ